MNTTRVLALSLALAFLALVFLAVSAPTAHAADPVIVRVKVHGATDGACGNTWATACNLQYALTSTVALPGTELWVAAGVYTPTTGTDRTATFQLRDNIALYGGFAMTETLRSQRNFTTNVSILSGDLNGDDNSIVDADEPTRAENSYHVVTGSGVTETAVLNGFTVTGGNANAPTTAPMYYGGGMYNDDGSPTVTNVTFSSNTAGYYGGGMYNVDNSNPILTNVTFSKNSASYNGGGMYNASSNPTLGNVTFSGNWSTFGGGMTNYNYSNPTLANVTFDNNTAGVHGGGMSNSASSNPVLTNVAFISNTAASCGGGVENYSSSPTMTSVTFTGNSASYYGGGMYNDTNSNPALTNTIFNGNSASIRGGGMANYTNSGPVLTTITFTGNSATDGGGMYNESSSPTLTNVTFSGNIASGNGGGVFNSFFSSPTLTNITLVGNSATHYGGGIYNEAGSSPMIRNAIIWANTPSGSQIDNADANSAALVSDSVVQGGYVGGTHIITADPLLGALGNYGGSTQTIPLLPGSSAINAGNDATCAGADQRGKPRVGICDIGAFESQGFTLSKASGDNQSTAVNTAFANPLRLTVSSGSGEPVNGGIVSFAAPSSGASAIPVTSTVAIASGVVSRNLTANGIAGSYTVTATTLGANPPVSFALTNKRNTTTMITSSANPSIVGQIITFTALVSGASSSGSVAFKDGGALLAGCGNVALSGGTAQCTVSSLAGGSHAITAAYSGDANDNASTSAAYTQTVSLVNDYLPLIRK